VSTPPPQERLDAGQPTTSRLPARRLVALSIALALVLLVVIAVALLVWHTPPLHLVRVPTVDRA
jgi:hypothetical protein